jgi:chromosome segregation ATPase
LSAFDDQIASLKAEQETILRNLQADQKRLSSLSTENRCPTMSTTLKQRVQEQPYAENTKRKQERQKTISQLQKDIEELQQIKEKASTAISNLQALLPRIEDLKTRLNEESKALAELSKEFEEKQKIENELRAQLEKVRAEIGRFDVSQLENAKKRREQAFQQYYSLESDLRTKENRKKDLMKRLDDVKERIDQAQKKIERDGKTDKGCWRYRQYPRRL